MNLTDLGTIGDNVTLLAAVAGALLPGLVGWVNNARWTSEVKAIVAAIFSLAVGVATAYVAGGWDRADIIRSVLIVFFLSQLAYNQYWKPAGFTKKLEARRAAKSES